MEPFIAAQSAFVPMEDDDDDDGISYPLERIHYDATVKN